MSGPWEIPKHHLSRTSFPIGMHCWSANFKSSTSQLQAFRRQEPHGLMFSVGHDASSTALVLLPEDKGEWNFGLINSFHFAPLPLDYAISMRTRRLSSMPSQTRSSYDGSPLSTPFGTFGPPTHPTRDILMTTGLHGGLPRLIYSRSCPKMHSSYVCWTQMPPLAPSHLMRLETLKLRKKTQMAYVYVNSRIDLDSSSLRPSSHTTQDHHPHGSAVRPSPLLAFALTFSWSHSNGSRISWHLLPCQTSNSVNPTLTTLRLALQCMAKPFHVRDQRRPKVLFHFNTRLIGKPSAIVETHNAGLKFFTIFHSQTGASMSTPTGKFATKTYWKDSLPSSQRAKVCPKRLTSLRKLGLCATRSGHYANRLPWEHTFALSLTSWHHSKPGELVFMSDRHTSMAFFGFSAAKQPTSRTRPGTRTYNRPSRSCSSSRRLTTLHRLHVKPRQGTPRTSTPSSAEQASVVPADFDIDPSPWLYSQMAKWHLTKTPLKPPGGTTLPTSNAAGRLTVQPCFTSTPIQSLRQLNAQRQLYCNNSLHSRISRSLWEDASHTAQPVLIASFLRFASTLPSGLPTIWPPSMSNAVGTTMNRSNGRAAFSMRSSRTRALQKTLRTFGASWSHHMWRKPTTMHSANWRCHTTCEVQIHYNMEAHLVVELTNHPTPLGVSFASSRSQSFPELSSLWTLSLPTTACWGNLLWANLELEKNLLSSCVQCRSPRQQWLGSSATKDPSAFERADCPTWLRKAAATFHANTWYHVRNDDKVTTTLRGTRPGDGWADLLFNVVIGTALQAIQNELQGLGLLTHYEWNSQRDWNAAPGDTAKEDALAVTWADDIAIMIQHGLAGQLVESLPTILSVFVDRLAERGLILNYGAGKTEILLLLRGPGSVACRRQLFATEIPTMTVESDHLGHFQVRLVTKYRHLGHTIHANGHMTTELRLRTGQAHSAFTKFRKSVFQNLALSLPKRTSIFRACVLSVFFWGSGTWPPLRPCEWRYFHGGYLRLLRRLLGRDFPRELLLTWSEEQLCDALHLVTLDQHLRIARLGYYGRLVRTGPNPLWALIALEQDWLQQLRLDFDWLWPNIQSQTFRPPPGSPEGLGYWHNLILHHAGTWKGLLKKAWAHAVLQIRIRVGRDNFNTKLTDCLQQHGWLPQLPAAELAEVGGAHWICMPCQQVFASKTAWATHSFRAHGRKAPARWLVDQNQCAHCLKSYLNPSRLYNHLRYSQTCFQALRRRNIYAEVIPGRGSQHWNSQEQFSHCPYLRLWPFYAHRADPRPRSGSTVWTWDGPPPRIDGLGMPAMGSAHTRPGWHNLVRNPWLCQASPSVHPWDPCHVGDLEDYDPTRPTCPSPSPQSISFDTAQGHRPHADTVLLRMDLSWGADCSETPQAEDGPDRSAGCNPDLACSSHLQTYSWAQGGPAGGAASLQWP